MHFDSESDNGRSWEGTGGGDGLDERRIWVSAMPNSRDSDCFVNGIEEIICEDDIQVVSRKRFPRIGKFSNKVGCERSKKIVHRKKKQQKKSALQRIQLGKATSRKLHNSSYFDNLNSGSFRSKGPPLFSHKRLEEERVGSPVELDVSFKSNALVVAMAVMAPSGTVVGSGGSSTTKINRIKKVTMPVSVSSSSLLTQFHEGPLSADGSPLGVDDSLSSDNGPMLSEEKHTVSGTGVIEDIGSLPCPIEVNVSIGKRAKEGSPVASSKASIDVNVSHDGKFIRKIMKERKITVTSSSLSISQASEISKEPRNADQSTSEVAAILSPDTGRMVSGHKTSMSDVQEIKNIGLQPCPNTATVLLVKDSVQGSVVAMVSDKEDTKIVPALGFVPNAKKIKKDVDPFSRLSSSTDVKSDATMNPIHLDKRGTVSDAMPADDFVSHCCTDGPTALLECGVVEGSTEAMIEITGDANFGSDGTRTPKSSEKIKFVSPPPACLSSQFSERHEKPIRGHSPIHYVDAVSSSDEVPVDSAEKVTVSETRTMADIGEQLCPCAVSVSLENSVVKGSPKSTDTVSDVLTVESNVTFTRRIKRKRKVQVLGIHDGLINVNSSTNSKHPTSRSDNVATELEEKSKVSDIGNMGNAASLSCSNGFSVTDEIITVKKSPRDVDSAKSVLNVGSDQMCDPSIKRWRKDLDLSSSQEPDIHGESIYTDSSLNVLSCSQGPDIHGVPINTNNSIQHLNTTTNSENVMLCSEQKVVVSCRGYRDKFALQPCLNEVSVLLNPSPVKESRKVIDSVIGGSNEDITVLDHPRPVAHCGPFVEHPYGVIPGVAIDGSLAGKTVALPSQEKRQPSCNLELTVGELNGMIFQTFEVPGVFQAQSSLVSGSIKDTAPSTHITNSWTWRQTDDPSAFLAGKRSSSSASPSQWQSPKKFGKVKSNSYILKGSSLVRKCNKDNAKCPYIHDPTEVAVCKKFLEALCNNTNCKLTHKVIPERMQDCYYFLQGLCTNENCPYRHVNVNPSAPVCEGFLRGYCADGDECRKKHSYVCPVFDATGIRCQEAMFRLHHPRHQYEINRRRPNDQLSKKGRYFGSRLTDITESCSVASVEEAVQNYEDIFFHEGRFVDYISFDFSDNEAGEANIATDMHTILCGSDPSELSIG